MIWPQDEAIGVGDYVLVPHVREDVATLDGEAYSLRTTLGAMDASALPLSYAPWISLF